MKCDRCGADVPEFLWIDNDHPVLIDYPIHMIKSDVPESHNLVKITVTTKVAKRMCSDVHSKPVQRPILELDQSKSLEEAVGLALGAASVCWDPMDGTGVFMSERCAKIGDELVEYINTRVYQVTQRVL